MNILWRFLESFIMLIFDILLFYFVVFRALTMPEDERIVRMNFLKRREKLNEVFAWARSFISELEQYDGVRSSFEPVTLLEIDSYMRR